MNNPIALFYLFFVHFVVVVSLNGMRAQRMSVFIEMNMRDSCKVCVASTGVEIIITHSQRKKKEEEKCWKFIARVHRKMEKLASSDDMMVIGNGSGVFRMHNANTSVLVKEVDRWLYRIRSWTNTHHRTWEIQWMETWRRVVARTGAGLPGTGRGWIRQYLVFILQNVSDIDADVITDLYFVNRCLRVFI